MRKFIAIAFGLAALTLVAGAEFASARDGLYRSVTIDTSRIAARDGRMLAANLKPLLVQHLNAAMPGRIGKSGAPLVIRITKIRLATTGGYDQTDYQDELAAEVIVPGRGVLPIFIALPPSAGAWYAPRFDERRVDALVKALAGWVAREV